MRERLRKPGSLEAARLLRRDSTPPEQILWKHVRNRRLGGLKFRRQVALGPYVADFFYAQAKLVVEVDELGHEQRARRDRRRDAWMQQRGFRVVRVSASDVTTDLDAVLQLILQEAGEGAGKEAER
jgi:very-short-patch-repair endonuclease